MPPADLETIDVSHQVLTLVPQEMAKRYMVVPLAMEGSVLNLAMLDPTDVVAIDDIEFATGLRVQPLVGSERAVIEAIGRLYGSEQEVQMRKAMAAIEEELNWPHRAGDRRGG